ncbi:unnamed protein product [Eretmochelys imbricata]
MEQRGAGLGAAGAGAGAASGRGDAAGRAARTRAAASAPPPPASGGPPPARLLRRLHWGLLRPEREALRGTCCVGSCGRSRKTAFPLEETLGTCNSGGFSLLKQSSVTLRL